MSREQSLIRFNVVLGIVILALGLVLILRGEPVTRIDRDELPLLFDDLAKDQIRRIDLSKPTADGREALRLELAQSGRWELASHFGYPTQSGADRLLDAIASVRVRGDVRARRWSRLEPMAAVPHPPGSRGDESAVRSPGADGEVRQPLTAKDVRNAARLLGEESPAVRRALRRAFASRPRLAHRLLAKRALDDDPRVRAHARAAQLELVRSDVVRRMRRRMAKPTVDLESGLFALARFADPTIDARPYRRALDGFAREFTKRAAGITEELDRGRTLARYLGEEVGFRGVRDGKYPPADVHVHRAIETRRGLPLTLTAVYLFVARRAGLRVGVVPLPGHIMLRLYGRRQNLIVDPFHGGEARSQAALMHYLAQHGLTFRSVWFRDADDKSLLLRQVRNLAHSLEIHELHAQSRALRPLLEDARKPPR